MSVTSSVYQLHDRLKVAKKYAAYMRKEISLYINDMVENLHNSNLEWTVIYFYYHNSKPY